ncbi:tRNA (adenosine(37)-N6)-threonylcarbamoyltransferase complex dimerization subunit type 1 TsaB [bacterium]|nr:tRNA (adenosine(37)-N6)-threonylcarbamoyltransferase complex dimerization subunit type 1 TsaB [bacterium]
MGVGPRILCLETSTRNCSVALFEDDRCLFGLEEAPLPLVHSDRLHPLIDEVLGSVHCPYAKLKAIAVGMGPGSYTGLRIGLSAAKGLCFALGIPLLPLSSLEILLHTQWERESQLRQKPATHYYPMIDARRMEVYTAGFDALGQRLYADRPMILEEELPHPVGRCFGDGSFKARSLLEPLGFEVLDGPLPSARSAGRLIQKAWTDNAFADLTTADPEYLKEFRSGKPAH